MTRCAVRKLSYLILLVVCLCQQQRCAKASEVSISRSIRREAAAFLTQTIRESPAPPSVQSERTSRRNTCRISGHIAIPATVEDVWEILSDYNRAAEYLPGLVESKLLNQGSTGSVGRPGDGNFRGVVQQRGVQKVNLGFDYSRIVLKISESIGSNGSRTLRFGLVENLVLASCHGSWTIREHRRRLGQDTWVRESILTYEAFVTPKFGIPAGLVASTLKQEIPTNLVSIRRAACQRSSATFSWKRIPSH